MAVSSEDTGGGVHRSRLFFGTCLALIPTGASFALVSNILVPLKQEFILTNYQVGLIGGAALWGMAISLLVMGPLLEAFGLKNGARLAFAGHLIGITLMIAAVTRVGDPSAFWMLMAGAATLAAGNGMIEVTGNPLVAALYPDEKTKRLNWFHAFFPIGIVLGGIAGWLLSTYGGRFGNWSYQLAIIYIPIIVYGVMVLPQKFPRTENAAVGIPVGDMFRYTLTNPFFLLMITMMAITTSMELGPMRWVPAVLQAGGLHGILVLVWISGWMVVLRALAGHFVERLAPTGMLLAAATLTGTGLFLLSFAQGTLSAFAAATVFAWGVAFFFPTMVGVVSERVPRTGSLGIVLTAGIGLGMAGAVGVPLMGRLADRYLAESLPETTLGVLQRVDQQFPAHVARARSTTDLASLGFRQREVEDALAATRTALGMQQSTGNINNDATANALRAIVATAIPGEPLVGEANGILQPAEASGGQQSFRYVAPGALILILVFGVMYMRDRARGGYKAVKLERAAAVGLVVLLALSGRRADGQTGSQQFTIHDSRFTSGPALLAGRASLQQGAPQRLRVLFLGDNGHHRPTQRAQQLLPALARNGIDLFYTDKLEDLNDNELDRYQALVLYNNHLNVGESQLAALMRFVGDGGGLVVLHCASASFQNSEEFIRLVGAAFKSHGTGTFSAVRVDSSHPAIAGVPTINSWDETYLHTKHNPVNRTVLEVRRENGHDEPWTWVRTYGKGRVFYTAWGHDQRTWGNEGFQRLIGQGIRWTIGDWALTQIARDPETKQVKLDVPLPTYKRPPAPWNVLDTAITVAQAALPTTESLRMMTLRPHFRAEPFATEPMIGNIIDFTWDARGRMWAVETNDYPNTVLPDSVPGNDRILIIEDANRDGRADRVKVFATGLNLATSLTFAGGGLVVGQAPHMLFFKDTNADDKADERKILFTGWPRTDTHGAISNLRYGFDNQVWGSVGYNGFRGTVGSTTYDRGQFGAGYFRFPIDASSLDYVARTSNNTWGVAFSEDGFVFGSTANSRPSNFVHIPIRYYRGIGDREPVLPDIADRLDVFPQIDILQVDQFGRYTAGAAHEIYTARAFPREYWNRAAFVAEPTAHVIGQFELVDNGSGFRARNRWSFMSARDSWVAPVQVKVGPDGAVWVSDFYTLVAQHNPTPRNMMGCCQTGAGQAYDTPNRDRLHGRIYRIVYDSAKTRQAVTRRLDNATSAQLVDALADDNMFWRQTAQRLLVERKATDAIPALIRRASDHTVDSLGLNPAALHALWTLHGLGALGSNADAMTATRNALRHPAASVRRAALMMLPRDAQLLTDILAAGILPDRGSPWPVEYTVPNSTLSDADMHVRLEATLVMSELPPSDRSANVIRELFGSLDNARDPWMPDAIAIAAAAHGPAFLGELMLQRVPQNADSITVSGLRRAVQRLARLHSTRAEIGPVVSLINTIPRAHPGLATALLEGIATGWPEERAPQLTPEQKATVYEAARTSSVELTPAFDRVAARWTLPNVFKVP
ncbi:MAG TPA: PVC-type heme-binding CxxCH protein [Gemmatimonadaceae bacterium]|nr:PVC-type heme-binding CxxCH protein [Gemmatimonadaceae bacterium]